ncbi:MAG: helix-turn-helix transcriptional regulator [Planctomycetes bacterium]|nr:helix-turn-helix transcriptional regulator [Planctomycetota bacterium]
MTKLPHHLRENIARNIRECRKRKFPGYGGESKCAHAFGVSPQQWSPWERGLRTPDGNRLQAIAGFFNVTMEFMLNDNRSLDERIKAIPYLRAENHRPLPAYRQAAGEQKINPTPAMKSPPPGADEDTIYKIVDHCLRRVINEGVTVKLDDESIAKLAREMRKYGGVSRSSW